MTDLVTGSGRAAPVRPARDPLADRLVAAVDTAAARAQVLAVRRFGLLVLAWRIARAATRGGVVAWRFWWSWVRVRELDPACRTASDLVGAHRYRQQQRQIRALLSLAAVGGAAVLALVGVLLAGALLVGVPAALAGSGVAVRAGRRDGDRLIRAARKPGRASQDAVTEALRAAGVIKASESLRFVEPVAKDGQAWATVVDLPGGTKAESARKALESIASALAVDEVQLELSRVRGNGGHAGRLAIWCAGSDPYAARPELSPLAGLPEWDFWQPFPFGRTARGRAVPLSMLWTHLLTGAIPRMGKTFAARLPACAAALDPYVRLIVFDGKGGVDWREFAGLAWRFGKGVRPATVERLRLVLEHLVADMNDRYDRLDSYSAEDVPEGKVTPAITRDPAAGMPLTLITIDEVHRYLEDKEHGEAILAALVELAKVGPAVGMILNLATQKPDADTIPSELRDVLGTRLAMKTMTWQSSDTILGAGSYKAGLDASKFARSHKGVGILLGADDEAAVDEPVTIRTDLLDAVGVRVICERGRQLRIDAGTLEGDAADGQELAIPARTAGRPLLDAALAAMGDGDRITSAALVDELRGVGIELADPTDLAERLDPYGVRPTDIRTPAGTRRGYYRDDVLAALTT